MLPNEAIEYRRSLRVLIFAIDELAAMTPRAHELPQLREQLSSLYDRLYFLLGVLSNLCPEECSQYQQLRATNRVVEGDEYQTKHDPMVNE